MAKATIGHASKPRLGQRFAIAFGLTVMILLVEAVAGIVSHSLALLSDAAHIVTDVFALGLGWFAASLATRPADAKRTWGYHRVGIVAALVNAFTLAVLTLYIFYEAIVRLQHPEPVNPPLMITAALLAIVVNLGIASFLRETHTHEHSHDDHDHDHHGDTGDLNMRAALLHVVSDIGASAGVVLGAIAIALTGRVEIDTAISVAIALLLGVSAVRVGRDAISVLLESVPKGLDTDHIRTDLAKVNGVHSVHDLHIWSITNTVRALSCHAIVGEQVALSQTAPMLTEMRDLLHQRYAIDHATVQFEACRQADHQGTPCDGDECMCSADPATAGTSRLRH